MFLKKLLKLLIKRGKKTIAIKNLIKALKILRPYIVPSRVNLILKQLAPTVKIYKKKVAGKVYQLPWYITMKRSSFQAAKWVMLGIEEENEKGKGKNLSIKIGKQIVKTLRGEGLPLKLKSQFLAIIKENRSYMRFIKRKRIKKRRIKGKIRKFRNKFTKRALKGRVKELQKELIKKYKNKDGKEYNKKIITKNKKYRR